MDMYHNSPDSGGHDGFWKTYMKLRKRFVWKDIKSDAAKFVICHACCSFTKQSFGNLCASTPSLGFVEDGLAYLGECLT